MHDLDLAKRTLIKLLSNHIKNIYRWFLNVTELLHKWKEKNKDFLKSPRQGTLGVTIPLASMYPRELFLKIETSNANGRIIGFLMYFILNKKGLHFKSCSGLYWFSFESREILDHLHLPIDKRSLGKVPFPLL